MNKTDSKNLYDVIIVGGGPSGLTASIYLARANYRVLIVEKDKFGGQITITNEVVNYPGVEHTDGKSLTEVMRKQAENFGAEFLLATVSDIETDGDIKIVHTSKGNLNCFGILIATGASPRMIGFQGEAEFRGRGVAYCATCDGEFFTGKKVFVIGGGFAAAEESVFLTKYASDITILIRENDFTCAKSVADNARNNEKITVLTNTTVDKVEGETFLTSIQYTNNKTGETTTYTAEKGDTFGVFVFAGYAPATKIFKDKINLNEKGYVITNEHQKTNIDGIYAAGDVCIKSLRQVVTAVGDGALAATELEKYASDMHNKTNLIPVIPEKKNTSARVNSDNKVQKSGDSSIFSNDILNQLNVVFSKMNSNLILELFLDKTNTSAELNSYMEEISKYSQGKVTIIKKDKNDNLESPYVRILNKDSEYTGLAFHGIPGGHEFTSFILGMYNAAGPGQTIDAQLLSDIKAINKAFDIKILVSLSCTMCPDLVVAAQRIAAENPNITTEIYDINHSSALKEKYNVMSVPCMVINDDIVSFGKKDIKTILEILK